LTRWYDAIGGTLYCHRGLKIRIQLWSLVMLRRSAVCTQWVTDIDGITWRDVIADVINTQQVGLSREDVVMLCLLHRLTWQASIAAHIDGRADRQMDRGKRSYSDLRQNAVTSRETVRSKTRLGPSSHEVGDIIWFLLGFCPVADWL